MKEPCQRKDLFREWQKPDPIRYQSPNWTPNQADVDFRCSQKNDAGGVTVKRILFVAGVLLTFAEMAVAQQTAATVVGFVTDSSGAAVAQASIEVRNLMTDADRQTASDATGNYVIPFVPAGTYRITVSYPGFRTNEVAPVTLQVGQTARIDFELQIGNVNESVDVSSTISPLQTENAGVGIVVDSRMIQKLPLNGRNFIQLAQLIPGTQTGTPGSITVRRGRGPIGQSDSAFGSTGLSVNGARDTANRYFIDGIEVMDGDAFTYAFPPSVDSLAEFRVQTNSYSAEYGTSPGAQVNLITKSGTKDYHGTLWEFNRNDALSSTYDAIAGKSLPSPRLNRNQFGANLGGPVRIPHIYGGLAKTYFFFNWEYGLQALGSVVDYGIVPTDAQRRGDLSGLVNARTGAPITLLDPLHIGIRDNHIPEAALSRQAQVFLQFEPHANTQNGVFNYATTPRSPVSTQQNYNGRLDHYFSSKDAVMVRYVINNTLEKGTPFWGHDERDNLSRTQNVAASYIRGVSPNISNEFRIGLNHVVESEIFGTSDDTAYDVAGKMGLPLISRRPQDYGPPSITINGADGSFSTYTLQRQIGPRARRYEVWQLEDTLAWQRRRHALRIGAELDRRNFYFNQARNTRGAFTFDGSYTGSALADFLLGYVKRANINSTPTRTNMFSWWQAYFLHDEWKIARTFTLSLGARYDYFQRWIQDDDRIVDIYQDGVQLTSFVGPNDSPYGRSLLAPDRNNFAPRVGFGWRPGFLKETVIRSGYGIYYQPEHPNASFSMVEGAQATTGGSVIGSTSGTPEVFFNDPFAHIVPGTAFNNATSIDPNARDAYIQQWNFTVQHQLRGDIILEAAYIGSKGTRLSIAFDEDGMAFNRPIALVDPRLTEVGSINERRPNPLFQRAVEGVKAIGNSTYHALQVHAERRSPAGMTFLTAYTWSKAMSGPHDQGGLIGNGKFIGSPQDYYNLRNERSVAGYDQTHRFVQTLLYDVPFFGSSRGFTGHVLGGWQVATIITAQSGFPAGIEYGIDTTETGQPSRADLVPGQQPNLPSSQRTWKKWFNTAAFAPAQWGQWGTSPRTGAIRLPGLVNCDLSFTKTVSIHERARFEFRTEIFNLTKHFNPDPGSVNRNVQSATFGSIGGGVQGVTTRVVQLGAKIHF
jgi:carboxypeptidase family protein